MATRTNPYLNNPNCWRTGAWRSDITRANGHISPDLRHLGSRQTIGAGIMENTQPNLARWLANTQSVKPGSLMPNMRLSDSKVNALVAYMEALR